MADAPEPLPPPPLYWLERHEDSLEIRWIPIAESPYYITATPLGAGVPAFMTSGSPDCVLRGMTANLEYVVQIVETEYTPAGPVPIPRNPVQIYTRPKHKIEIEQIKCEVTGYGIRVIWDISPSELMLIGNVDKLRIMVGKQDASGEFQYEPAGDWSTGYQWRLGRSFYFDFTRDLPGIYALRLVAVGEPPHMLNQAELWGPTLAVDLNSIYDHEIPNDALKFRMLPEHGAAMGGRIGMH